MYSWRRWLFRFEKSHSFSISHNYKDYLLNTSYWNFDIPKFCYVYAILKIGIIAIDKEKSRHP